MNTLRFLAAMILMSLSGAAFAATDAQTSFDKLKGLAGSWEGVVSTIPQDPSVEGTPMQVSLRVTSSGNALMHEMTLAGHPDDPITMLYLDGDRLLLTHYCDAGNRPRMTGTISAGGNSVQFHFLDASGNMKYGHMQGAAFTFVDADHHSEEWTFLMPGDKAIRVHLDLKRKQ